MRKVTRRGKAILAATVTATIGLNAGIAWAYWRSTASAAGSGTAGSMVSLRATGAAEGGALLHPGVRRNLVVTVANDNSFSVRLTELRRAGTPVTVDAAHAQAGCVHSGVSLTNAAYALLKTVPAGGSTSFTLSNGLTMTNESDSACQGATFKIPLTISGQAKP